ncbi:MAG: transposase [Haloquadratum walsbyi J07HQW2]|uniref:Transposase n=1 Tax=Haloquadratum walsbyi J07HQW2 TaxID=1238425 RepID=U1PK96_9EURY|nr:MAG: transposase [Haloquadratum walsbyi J07HQW2]
MTVTVQVHPGGTSGRSEPCTVLYCTSRWHTKPKPKPKPKKEGITLKQVGSEYTSKRCAECGFPADENRPTRTDFRCVNCGSEANADSNAAKNIGRRYVVVGGRGRATGDSQLALKSGTVTPNGGFTAYPDRTGSRLRPSSRTSQAPPHPTLTERTRQGERSRVG